jgi:hypothetical protein
MSLKQRCISLVITLIFIRLCIGCSSIEEKNWIHLIPEESSFVIIPKSEVNLQNIGTLEYASILDDLTPSAIQKFTPLPVSFLQQIDLKAMLLYPASSLISEFIWVTESSAKLNQIAPNYYEPFEQNNYSFDRLTIHKLQLSDYTLFAAQVHNWIIFSESSIAIEGALRTYLGKSDRIKLQEEPQIGQLIVNSNNLDSWVQQFVAIGYRPNITGSTDGFAVSSLLFTPSDNATTGFELTGVIELDTSLQSTLTKSVSTENTEIILDKYISGNAAAFSIFRYSATYTPYVPNNNVTPLDSILLTDTNLYRELALSIAQEVAIVAFPESGLLSNGEFLFLRNMESAYNFRSNLDALSNRGVILKQGNSYYIKSRVLSKLIGTEMAPFTDFYLSFSQNVAIISKRRGLSESVDADRTRRRTIYYDETFRSEKALMKEGISGFIWVKCSEFMKFMKPLLVANTSLSGLIGSYDILSMSFQKNSSNSVSFQFKSVTEDETKKPYDELWVLPLESEQLMGSPTLGNIVGSPSEEIIIATSSGRVEALAYDGTSVMQAFTNEGDIPIGSPILYDWYGNGQPVILQAAGSKIYAWNKVGRLLPQFPIEIGERISAPIVVSDVSRNGIPEIILATENRKIHVVDGRGQNLRGWPQITNAVVNDTPEHVKIDNEYSIWVVSQNILHGWQKDGSIRQGYPAFINSNFNTAPTFYKENIIGAGSDGYLYSIGQKPSFLASLSTSIQVDSITIKSLYATSSQLNNISVYENVLLRDSTRFYRSDLYVTQSANGSILMFNPSGELKVSHNLGQPTSNTFTPQIVDINGDNKTEIIALADFGRLFAWEILSGRRLFNIPTSGMKYPIIEDINGDGSYELIAQTREGLRCWTINKPED